MDIERAQKKVKELQERKQRGNKDFWNPKPGKNYIRVLPNWKCEPGADFFRETGYHRKLGPAKDKSAVCLIKEGQNICPGCEAVKALYKTKDKEDAALAKEIKQQTRVLYNVVDMNDKSKGVQIWMSGVDVLTQIMLFCANPKYGDITDPETGRNIELNLTEASASSSGFNSYNVQPDPERTPIDNVEWLSLMKDLDEIVKPIPPSEMEEMIFGLDEEKPVEQKPVEQKPVEQKPVEQKPVEQKPVEQKPVEQKPVEQKPEEKPVTAETKSSGIQEMLKKIREERKPK